MQPLHFTSISILVVGTGVPWLTTSANIEQSVKSYAPPHFLNIPISWQNHEVVPILPPAEI